MTSAHKGNGFSRFLIIWGGELLSALGSGLTAFTLGVHAFRQTGLATGATLVVLFTFLPAFVLRPVGGVLADRMDRRLLMIIGNLGSALGIGFIVVMFWMNNQDLWVIYSGVAMSSVFFAFQNPAYKASVSDFLPKELYAKASGMMQISNSAQFLLSPLIAGFLMSLVDIRFILVIDILTFVTAGVAVLLVRRAASGEEATHANKKEAAHFFRELAEGFHAVTGNRGVFILVLITSLVLFYVGLLQSLFGPMVLSFANEKTAGAIQSMCALGMLGSAVFIGGFGAGRRQVMTLSFSLAFSGIFFAFIGLKADMAHVVIPGFLFFFTLPFINSSIEVLIRGNIGNEKQGRAWSLISVFTYSGAIIAYSIAGFLADKVFNPLLVPGGALEDILGPLFGSGPGRGIAVMFFISGISVAFLPLLIFRLKSIRRLEG
jgi:MFS family permease